VGLQDTYAHGASREHLAREYGLDALAIVRAAERLLGEPLGIEAEDLADDPAADDAGPAAAPSARNADSL
jgi:hypothetical protein